jgi:acyl dehydratase
MTTRRLDEAPSPLPLMLKAALPTIPGVATLPGVRKTSSELPELELLRESVAVDRSHVGAYAQVCGFPRKDTLPLPYLHMLAFPLHMALLTDPSFPYAAMGLVHLENTITRHREARADERFDVSVSATNLRPHAKGRMFDMVSRVWSDGDLVWDEVSTYLRRGKGEEGASQGMQLDTVDGPGIEWRLPGDLGRRYGAVSGDRNPIHLYPVTAKALGFPRQIAHGMWTKARSIAAVENRLPEKVTVDVAFKKPVFLPGTVEFRVDQTSDEIGFALVSPRSGAPHLLGRAR